MSRANYDLLMERHMQGEPVFAVHFGIAPGVVLDRVLDSIPWIGYATDGDDWEEWGERPESPHTQHVVALTTMPIMTMRAIRSLGITKPMTMTHQRGIALVATSPVDWAQQYYIAKEDGVIYPNNDQGATL